MSDLIEVRTFAWDSAEYNSALRLRRKVLREPLGLVFSEQDLEPDRKDTHIGAFKGGDLVGCLILTFFSNQVQMRQVAVDPSLQKQGVGRELVRWAEKICTDKRSQKIFLSARIEAVPFYKNLGYSICSDSYMSVGIPHYKMEKILSNAF